LSLLDELNPEQREAVTTIDGPVLIFAGAGSGKTRALTYRIAYMVQEKGIAPSKILAVTFTNKAADEMKGRIVKLIGQQAADLWAGTFHSICCRILRRYGEKIGISPNFVIYDEADQQALIKQAVSAMNVDSEQYTPARILNSISSGKNELLDVSAYRRTRKGPFEELVARAYARYQEALVANNALDFDDLLMRAVELLETRPEVLKTLQDQFNYILVDEYQDINHAQYRFIRLVSARDGNICVVGDDDQSIYGWRGANVGLILNFQADFPKTKVVKLEQNYRSTQNILACAYQVICHNEDRADKKLWTENGQGDNLVVYEAVNEEEEASWAAGVIGRQVSSSGTRYGDYAILYRTNAMSRVFEAAMRDLGVPYEIVGGISFYDRAEVKDIAAYLKVILNPTDAIGLQRIINRPARKIGAGTVKRLTEIAHAAGVSLYEACPLVAEEARLRKAQEIAVLDFYDMMEGLRKDAEEMGVAELLRQVLERSGYIKSLEATGKADDADRVDNLGELVTDAVKYEKTTPEPTLVGFLERLALLSDIDRAEELDSTVSLMTLHSAKGLEFPIVFIVGLEEGTFPHRRSMGDEFELAEERRLCYVGLTRAQRMVYMSHAHGRTIFGQPQQMRPSRFLEDLPPELIRELDSDNPLMPRMFGDEEAALQQQQTSEFKIDMTEILQRARAGQQTAQKRPLEDEQAEDESQQAAEADKATKTKKTKVAKSKKKAPRDPKKKSKKKKSSKTAGFSHGVKVVHEDFGEGIVVSVADNSDEPTLTVAFKKGKGVKAILANHPKLKLLS